MADCDGTGQCFIESWIGDGICDGEDQQWGADLTCYEEEYCDCTDIVDDPETDEWDGDPLCAPEEEEAPASVVSVQHQMLLKSGADLDRPDYFANGLSFREGIARKEADRISHSTIINSQTGEVIYGEHAYNSTASRHVTYSLHYVVEQTVAWESEEGWYNDLTGNSVVVGPWDEDDWGLSLIHI